MTDALLKNLREQVNDTKFRLITMTINYIFRQSKRAFF